MTPYWIAVALMAALFVVWAVAMFSVLWRLTLRSLERLDETGGGYFRWAGHSIGCFAEFLSHDRHRAERRRLLLLTLALVAVTMSLPFLAGVGR